MAKRKRLTPADPGTDPAARTPAPTPSTAPLRRAPIADVAGEASARAALDEVTDTLRRAREDGRMIVSLSLDQVALDHLVRDRVSLDTDDMDALINSLRARGQQTPIEVVALDTDTIPPRYGLISGWRRCQALRILFEETRDRQFAYVQALLRRPDQASDAYLAMVEENEIRAGLSYYERAHIVVRAVEQGVYETEKAALQALFHSASRAKRSKIRSFLPIVEDLGPALRFPEALGERAGLVLSKALEADRDLAFRLMAQLRKNPPADAAAELAVLARAAPERSAKTPSGPDPRGTPLAENLWLRTHGNGDVTLSGKALTPALRGALTHWLRQNG